MYSVSMQSKLSHSSVAGITEVWLQHLPFRGMRANGMKTNNSSKSVEVCLCSTEPKQHWLPRVGLSGFDNISINIEMSTALWGHSSAAGLTTVWRGVSVKLVTEQNVFWHNYLRSHKMQIEFFQLMQNWAWHWFNKIMFRMLLIELEG